jgi:hypothetical protein
MIKRHHINKLPVVHHTTPLKKFIQATVDQLFYEKESEKLDGFIGQRVGGNFDVNTDFYISEDTKARLNYQLEPVALTKNPDTFVDENLVFYEDILNRIQFYHGHINNHDRLFESDFYSYAPPIDVDKFLNYNHYYWVPSFRIEVTDPDSGNISIEDFALPIYELSEADINTNIVGQATYAPTAELTATIVAGVVDSVVIDWGGSLYVDGVGYTFTLETTAGGGNGDAVVTYDVVNGQIDSVVISAAGTGYTDGAFSITDVPESMELSSGMPIKFASPVSGAYYGDAIYIVDRVGRDIRLVNPPTTALPYERFIYIPWDSVGTAWDSLPWDAMLEMSVADYITIERGSCDGNGWSRTNRWIHSDVVKTVASYLEYPIPANFYTQGIRPILEFVADIEMYQSGTKLVDVVESAESNRHIEVSPPTGSAVVGQTARGFAIDGNAVGQGAKVIFPFENLSDSELNAFDQAALDKIYTLVVPGTVVSGVVNSGGVGYSVNDTLTLVGGTGTAATFNVDTVDGGIVTSVSLVTAGDYSVGPANPVATTVSPAGGSGCTLNVTLDGSVIDFVPVYTASEGDVVVVTTGLEYGGITFYFNGTRWVRAESQKLSTNYTPKFQLYDCDGIMIDDETTYPSSIFKGSEIFSYKENEDSIYPDPVLGIPLVYTGLGEISDIVFENDLQTDRYTYLLNNVATEISGYYFYNLLNGDEACDFTSQLSNEWKYSTNYKQRIIDRYILRDTSILTYDLSALPYQEDIIVKLDGLELVKDVDYLLYNDSIELFSVVDSVEIETGGSGYSVYDVLTVSGGVGSPIKLIVTEVNGDGRVTGVEVNSVGYYSEFPTNPVVTSANPSGGIGCTLNLTPAGFFDPDQVLEVFTYARENCTEVFTVYDISEHRYKLAHNPTYPEDVVVTGSVSGIITNVSFDNKFLVIHETVVLTLDETITVEYISEDNLTDSARGYYEIPQSLENNPLNEEITNHSYNDFVQHFLSIVKNQTGQEVIKFGQRSTYRDSAKDTTRGEFILQNRSSLLKAMLVTANDELNLIEAIQLASREYNRFKNKFLQEVYNMDRNNEFSTIHPIDNSVEIDAWMNEIINRVQKANATNNTFNNSFMISLGTVYKEEIIDSSALADTSKSTVEGNGDYSVDIDIYEDLDNLKNTLYIFAKDDSNYVQDGQRILLESVDYTVTDSGSLITLRITKDVVDAMLGEYDEIYTASVGAGGSGYVIGDVLTLDGVYTGSPATVTVTSITTGGAVADVDIAFSGEYDSIPTTNPVDTIGGSGVGATIGFTSGPKVSIDALYVRLYNDSKRAKIPPTPTKLGMYQATVPKIYVDYTVPTPDTSIGIGYIIGHDGSRIPAFGDIRDTMLFELEKRIYNNIAPAFKGEYKPLLSYVDVWPGKFRDTNYTLAEIDAVLKPMYVRWANNYRVNWTTNDTYNVNDEWTYNYRGNGVNESILPGYWRGIHKFYYDTDRPDTSPWEMLGFANMPDWWESTTDTGDGFTGYGSYPWTSSNSVWTDLENGLIRRGERAGTDSRYARPGLVTSYLPVDVDGDLKSPIDIGIAVYPALDSDRENSWSVGDYSPTEMSWRTSSNYPYALMQLLYLTKPAKFGELFWDTLETTTSVADPTQIVNINTCKRSQVADLTVHGETINNVLQIKTGYQQWISDRLVYLNKSVTAVLGDRVRTLRSKLGHRMAGFTVEDTFKLFSETISPESSTNTLLLPNESITLNLVEGPSIRDYVYSGVVIRVLSSGQFMVYGYDMLDCVFHTHPAKANSRVLEINVGGKDQDFRYFEPERTYRLGEYVKYNSVYYRANVEHFASRFIGENWTKVPKLPTNGGVEVSYYQDRNLSSKVTYDYGHIFDNSQEVFDFLIGYGEFLEQEGWVFDNIDPDTSTVNNFIDAGKQFLLWVTTSFEPDSVITVSPNASRPKLKVERGYPQSVERTNNGVYSLLDEEGVVIDKRLTAIERDDQTIEVIPLGDDIRIYYMRVSASETEHVVTIDNITTFNDVLLDPLMGIRQPRLRLNAARTTGWIGKYEAPGYLIDTNDRLIPNIENTTESIRRYHDTEVKLDVDLVESVAKHLIGYEEKDYLVNLELDDDVQYQFYQGAIREKGTEESIKKLLRSAYVTLEQDIDTYEEWALKLADYGATCERKKFDVAIKSSELKTDPQLIVLDTPNSRSGYVDRFIVVNAVTEYTTPPTVGISLDPYDTGNGYGAIGNPILNDAGYLIGVEVIEAGSGYIKEPIVYISGYGWDSESWDTTGWDPDTDKVLSVVQYDLTPDQQNDDIIFIDADDPDRWIIKPRGCGVSDLIPQTTETYWEMPSSGWVNINDVDNTLFNIENFISLWESQSTNRPIIEETVSYDEATDEITWNQNKRQTLYVAIANTTRKEREQSAANTFNSDWNVYRTIDFDLVYGVDFKLTNEEDANGTVLKLYDYADVRRDNLPYINPDERDPRQIANVITINIRTVLDKIPLSKSHEYVTYKVEPFLLGDTENGAFRVSYTLYDSNGEQVTIDQSTIDSLDTDELVDARLWGFFSCRFGTEKLRDYRTSKEIPMLEGEYVWVDKNPNGKWEAQRADSVSYDIDEYIYTWETLVAETIENGVTILTPRVQAPLIDTHKYTNAFLYDKNDEETIAMLPVFDPYKGIISGRANQNIDYITESDPARYTTASEERILDPSFRFDATQLGVLWWDTSQMRYLYYEQGTNRERRDNWGRLFPGSSIEVYEWSESPVPPAQYVGEGSVKNTTDYVESLVFDPYLNATKIVYYFWIRGKKTITHPRPNRTLSAAAVENLIRNPARGSQPYFAPINYHSNDNTWVRKHVEFNRPSPRTSAYVDPQRSDAGVIENIDHTGFDVTYTHFEKLELYILPRKNRNKEMYTVSVGSGGSGYVIGDTLILDGVYTGNPAKVTVTSTAVGGVVTGVDIAFAGTYSSIPTTNPVATIGGSGVGATIGFTSGPKEGVFKNYQKLNKDVDYTVEGQTITYIPDIDGLGNIAYRIEPGDTILVDMLVYSEQPDQNAFVVYNINQYIDSIDSVFQVNYVDGDPDHQVHTEWHLVAEGDVGSEILDIHWDKMIDSVLGQTDIIKWKADVSGYCSVGVNRGFLLVPDPMLSYAERYGTMRRPRQTWFVDMVQARVILVNKLNALFAELNIRDDYLGWEETFVDEFGDHSDLWKWVTWYADGWDVFTAVPSRRVETPTIMESLDDVEDGDIIKVLDSSDPTDRYTVYVYDSELQQFNLIAREAATVEFQSSFYEFPQPEVRIATDMRSFLSYIEQNIFVGDYLLKKNALFFSMLNYAMSENKKNDWAFKTTYLLMRQRGLELEQLPLLTIDPTESMLAYIEAVKPYHTKVRDYSVARNAGVEELSGLLTEIPNKRITLKYNRVSCRNAEIATPGLGYAEGDTVFIVGGVGTPMELYIDSVDDRGRVVNFTVVSSGLYSPNYEPVSPAAVSGGSGIGATFIIVDNDCAGDYAIRDAYTFNTPSYPWDATLWDEDWTGDDVSDHPWDGDMLSINYYSASDSALPIADQFNDIEPEMTINGSAPLTVVLTFTPTSNAVDNGPYVFINDVYTTNFTYDSIDNSIEFFDQPDPSDIVTIYDILPFDGGQFLQTFSADDVPEELVPLDFNEDLVITILRDIYRCEVVNTSSQQKYWLPVSDVNTATIDVLLHRYPSITVDVTGGAVTAVTLVDGGEGFPPSQAGLLFTLYNTSGGGNYDAVISYDTDANGYVSSVSVSVGGSGYTDGVGITIEQSDLPSPSPTSIGAGNFSTITHGWDDGYAVDLSTLVTNGDFSAGSANWTADANWTIGSGVASSDGTSGNLDQTITLQSGVLYKVDVTVSNYVSGTLTPVVGGTSGSDITADGTYTQFIEVASGSVLRFESDLFDGDIDDIAVYRTEAQWGWDSCCCEGPQWDVDNGVSIDITITEGSILNLYYELNSGTVPSAFDFKYHMRPSGWQDIYRLCDNQSAVLTSDFVFGDTTLELANTSIGPFDAATLLSPGYIWIDGELIAYHDYEVSGSNLILKNFERGVDGTSVTQQYSGGTRVYNAREENKLGSIDYDQADHSTNDFTADQTTFLSDC